MIIQTPADAEAFAHLNIAMLRILISKEILDKDDIMADLARQNCSGEIGFAISRLIDDLPKK